MTKSTEKGAKRNAEKKNSTVKHSTGTKNARQHVDIPLDQRVVEKYARGSLNHNDNKIKFKALRMKMKSTQENIVDGARKTAATEILLQGETGYIEPEGNERTFKFKQEDIRQNVDLNTAKNSIDLQLTKFGPYRATYSRNGRYSLFCGQKGHVAIMDCQKMTVGTELMLQEEVHDAQFLHNETLFAVAQNKYTYIYDSKGIEIHCMKKHERTYRLDYLPYHYLLTSVGHSGWIKWHDISIGAYVTGYQTGNGPCRVLKHNPVNAVSHCGHSNGVVSLWSPASGKALVSMFCHKSPVTDLAIDREGRYMATTGLDGYLKIWDLRKFSYLHCFKLDRPATSVDISEKGLVAIGTGRHVQVLKDCFLKPGDVTYLKHSIRTPNASLSSGGGASAAAKALLSSVSVSSVKFRPLEDVLCAGHSHGITTIITPGAGESNFDSFENNPFMNPKQRREMEIQSLINKLSHEMISLDASFIGSVDKDYVTLQKEHQELFNNANATDPSELNKDKDRKRGRNKISAKLRRKQKNVVDLQTIKLNEKLKEDKEKKMKATATLNDKIEAGQIPVSLKRFLK